MSQTILIAIPTYENIEPETFSSILHIFKNPPEDTNLLYKNITGYGVAHARNKIVDYAFDAGADKLFFVDNDVVLKPSSLELLLSSSDAISSHSTVVLGYYAKTENHIWQGATSLFKIGGHDYDETYSAEELKELREQGQNLIEVRGGGFGCALIDMDIFAKVEYPWFHWRFYSKKPRRRLSEDLYFCSKCRKAGIHIMADTRVGCGHVLKYVQEVM